MRSDSRQTSIFELFKNMIFFNFLLIFFFTSFLQDYNCSVDFVNSPFLVRESSYKGVNGSFETLRLDLMDSAASMYEDADILIFNTAHWWTHEKTSRG